MTAAIVIALLALLLVGLPLYLTLFGIAAALFATSPDLSFVSMTISFQKLQSQEFITAIPLFIFAGTLLAKSKSPERIVELFKSLFSFVRGADAILVVLLMAFFTPLTGASGIGILAIGGLMLPLLAKNGRNETFSLGLITSSGSIGLLLVPSLPVIMYAIISSQNGSPVEINRLFHAALIPSAILIGSFIIYILIYDMRKAVPTVPFSGDRFLKALWNARFEVPIPVLIYGGIYSGLFTVMEAALVIAVYVFIMNFFLYRDFSLRKEFLNITSESMKLSGGIFIIMATAFVLTNFLVSEEIPAKTFRAISPYIKHPAVFLLAINVFLLFVGGLLDIFSAILVVLPILLPIVSQYGVNPYHFAIMFLINLELGYLIPPHGINLFIASYSFKKPITFLYKVSVPFLLVMTAVLLLITYVPSLSLFGVSSNNKTSVGVSRTEPNTLSSISVKTPDGAHALISFTAPSAATDFTEYQIRYLDSEIKGVEDLDFANEMIFSKALVGPGKTQTLELAPLVPKTKYYFSLRALNKKGETGKWSDILSFTTPEK